jgi:urease accessory protein
MPDSMNTTTTNPATSSYALLRLLQLTSPSLPVGAYSYSEGLETLVDRQVITNADQELRYGTARIDGAIVARCYQAAQDQDWGTVVAWNRWLSANRETEELRLQSLQMGRSLWRLWQDLDQENLAVMRPTFETEGCHFAVMFGLIAAVWQIEPRSALLGYLHSWMSNLIAAGIKLIPLGQTAGQRLLLDLNPAIEAAVEMIFNLSDAQLSSCSWGLSIASMAHETQYSRLFRS